MVSIPWNSTNHIKYHKNNAHADKQTPNDKFHMEVLCILCISEWLRFKKDKGIAHIEIRRDRFRYVE